MTRLEWFQCLVVFPFLLFLIMLPLAGTANGIDESQFDDFPVIATYDQRQHTRLEELPFQLLEIIPHDDEGLLEDIGEYVAWFGYVIDLRDGTYYNWFLYSDGCAAHIMPYDGEDYYSWTTCPTYPADENSG